MNVLFICSRNQWRSPTAEAIFRNSRVYIARSAGTADSARIKINAQLIEWADMIFVMEKKHKEIIRKRFDTAKKIIVLDIPDEYTYMDSELIAMLTRSLIPYLNITG